MSGQHLFSENFELVVESVFEPVSLGTSSSSIKCLIEAGGRMLSTCVKGYFFRIKVFGSN